MLNLVSAIILAAGKGKRMKSKNKNKVVLPIKGKPMILYEVELLEKIGIKPIIVVVGFAKDSVREALGKRVLYTEQNRQLGTADAVRHAIPLLPNKVCDVIIIQGDDAVFYAQKGVLNLIKNLIKLHTDSKSDVTLLTITLNNPFGLGRILRDKRGKIVSIVEEKNASLKQKKIKEINPACYVFRVEFLKQFLGKIKRDKASSEYYLTDIIEKAVLNKKKIEALNVSGYIWRGVNTPLELEEAEKLLSEALN